MIIPAHAFALPAVKTVAECADFSKTFGDYLPQLYALPTALWTNASDLDALKAVWAMTNPAISSLAAAIVMFPFFLIGSEINKNYSQVDRFWSILPTLFNAHYAIWARFNGLPTQRIDHVLSFSVVWTLRLTYNYWRKGGYSIGSEDYRWVIVKERIGPVGFFILNVVFISSWQVVLLWAVTLPTYVLLLVSKIEPTLTIIDTFFGRGLILLVAFEFFADQQMWDYQQAKKSYQETAKVPAGWSRGQMDRGFVTTGLWRWSRHPNFAAEQTIWVVLYAWGCWHTGTWLNWTAVGMLNYIAIFAGSTPLTERITAGKYAEYPIYQQRVGRFLPKLFGKRWDEAEMHRVGPKLAEAKKSKKQK